MVTGASYIDTGRQLPVRLTVAILVALLLLLFFANAVFLLCT